ncbi:MAG: hypothetical protein HY922_13370 [Elusimicrobia bacterium]|nr:hypothetical protein [Elusimicrobiota bacterium]
MLPSLFLMIYLLFETAKISREKIRHQFAVDAASFIEMTNYSDFLNRSAYVNGAFPQRIFYEGFYNTKIERKDATTPDRLFDILYKNGAFPMWEEKVNELTLDPERTWYIKFGGTGGGKNGQPGNKGGYSGEPDMSPDRLDILTMADALKYWINWDDAQDIYKLYVQIYQLLGSVEEAQYSVFERLINKHNFFRKSYWLNTGEDCTMGNCGADFFDNYQFKPVPYCIRQVMIYGNKPTSNAFQPYQIWAPDKAVDMPPTIKNCRPPGLFQLEAIPDAHLANMASVHAGLSNYQGYPVIQNWTAPDNYFLVNFNGLVKCPAVGTTSPCVHATVMLSGGKLWPYPTPKFQVRLYP